MKNIFSLAIFLLCAGALVESPLYAADRAVPDTPGERVNVDKECADVAKLQPPTTDMPSKIILDDLSGCKADELYYDTQSDSKATQGSWNKVRACGFVNGDDLTLMMLYANGFGVKRNYNLAINYACNQREPESGFAVDVMVEELLRRNKSGSEEQLDLCDFAGTTFAISYCIGMKEGQKERARIRRLDEIRISMDGRQKAFFDMLREAAQNFASSSSRNEVDQLGSGRAGFVIDAEAELKESFLNDIEKCEQGVFPEYTLVQFTAFDKQLNKTYQAIMHTQTEEGSDRLFSTNITKSGIKEAQRTWLKFRDAWVKYGEARYPNVSTHTWKAMLTERRVKQLEGLLNSDPP